MVFQIFRVTKKIVPVRYLKLLFTTIFLWTTMRLVSLKGDLGLIAPRPNENFEFFCLYHYIHIHYIHFHYVFKFGVQLKIICWLILYLRDFARQFGACNILINNRTVENCLCFSIYQNNLILLRLLIIGKSCEELFKITRKKTN